MSETLSPPLRVSGPDMHHGTCVTHVPWCMSGSLTSFFSLQSVVGNTFLALPAHAQPAIFSYLVRGPWESNVWNDSTYIHRPKFSCYMWQLESTLGQPIIWQWYQKCSLISKIPKQIFRNSTNQLYSTSGNLVFIKSTWIKQTPSGWENLTYTTLI